MPRHSKPTDLDLLSRSGLDSANGSQSGPSSSPMNLQGVDLTSFGGSFEHDVAAGLTPLPALPTQSPPTSPRLAQGRDPSKSFLTTFKNRISPDHEQHGQKKDLMQGNNEEDQRPGTSNMTKVYHLRKNPGSTPELSLVGSHENMHKEQSELGSLPLSGPRPQAIPHHSEDSTASAKRKDKTFKLAINRSKSIRRDSDSKSRIRVNGTEPFTHQVPPNTAPLQSDWPGAESRMMLGKSKEKEDKRGKSAERTPATGGEDSHAFAKFGKEPPHSNFKANTKIVKKGVFGTIARNFNKIGRSGSSHEKEKERDKEKEREVADSQYEPKIIRLPLVDQTRLTRISKELAQCRDKTEYWMPSLPWRCIDFLNQRADEEGLYRVPGSGNRVKLWQRRFDTELDVNLLNEDIPDTNEIASVLKAWLRELPSEILPAKMQQELAVALEKVNPNFREAGHNAPQELRDALSELPPFNYYLLFAVTCHLSLILASKDRNRMDLNNLAICVNPALNIERWLFNYLVGDWRHCWQGCYTEKDYLRIEILHEQGSNDETLSGYEPSFAQNGPAHTINDTASEALSVRSHSNDRAVSSTSGSAVSKPGSSHEDGKPSSKDAQEQPSGYLLAGSKGFPNGSVGRAIGQDVKRPHTADPRHSPVSDASLKGSANSKSRSNSTTPKPGHERSLSDLPGLPINTSGGADARDPVRPTS